ncbi:putative 5'-3' exoribonuclease C [Trypanosoma cruzi]|uniref:Putative 5'-3' exoribonuclease C n=1 Tax=Trypanosoma cruzi TaxID=5693 RepID=A0A2V2X075_TRYCR|nr:putative 5'-3' exoribonuclease C [Trypanosoma cruzi]RNC56366.1 putative 5'-3' exonuclease XRNC [Trypanosoma cruzi]
MGVPLLLTWLKRRFAPCFLSSSSCPAADCLYIDVNGLVYQAAALATASEASAVDIDAAILRKLFDILDDIVLRLVRPRFLVYLAVDGISPMGKLAQQRSRRRRRSGGGSRGRNAVEWDSNSISVGTPFMSRLTEALHFYCASRAERINGKRLRDELQQDARGNTTGGDVPVTPITFIVDDVWRPGEGESKIADAIRRFRSQPTYDPNTSHIICSSDTDVTVCSLILHEPRIHVLRYECSPSHHSGGAGRGGDSGSWRNQVGDAWASTFFSIHAFREELRNKLRLQTSRKDSAEEAERRNRQFERALHDVVFVLLLFGNDFLPSVGCRIEEGFLDDLLELLATDFISRDRSIIDPVTNTIQFDSARYALDSLAEMRRERACGDGLCVDNGKEGATDWGFVDDTFRKQRQLKEEAELAPKCYAYWTMLQWSLQNSAGVVEHWGCYYPYGTAPPLHLLRKYCGMLSYDALMELAKKRSHSRHRGATSDSNAVETTDKLWDDGPGDVLVQLLVLLPARSTALLPSAVRNAYGEIEHMVLAPVEQMNFSAISAWCEEKKAMFTEEERTRFRAYALAARPHMLAQEVHGAPIHGSEMVFVADWDAEAFAMEVQQAKSAMLSEITTAEGLKKSENGAAAPAVSTSSLFVSSFFDTRPARKASSAAAAALIAASKKAEASDRNNRNEKSACSNESHTNDAPLTPAVTVQEKRPRLSEEVEVRQGRGFTLVTAPTEVLGDVAMIKNVGSVVGDTFVCGQHTSPPLSRNPRTMRVRLRWRVASKPLLTSATFVPDLLPGYITPPSLPSAPSSSSHETNKAVVKRPASAMNVSDSNSGNSDNGDYVDKKGEVEEGKGDFSTCNVISELEKKKEAVRRRLEALQSRVGGNAL